MASALNIPVIGLYAAHNIERVGPYRDRSLSVSVWKELAEASTESPQRHSHGGHVSKRPVRWRESPARW